MVTMLDNQAPYWDQVAQAKTFTHPLDLALLTQFVSPQETVIDYGCGYGRVLRQLHDAGFAAQGYDVSEQLIGRGRAENPDLADRFHHLPAPPQLPLPAASVGAVLLLAVLTCIPSNAGQRAVLAEIERVLRPGGVLYLSDYYVQALREATGAYGTLHDDAANYGVFTLPEGVTFRHHRPAWIAELTARFVVRHAQTVAVHTMSGRPTEAFQLLLQKPG